MVIYTQTLPPQNANGYTYYQTMT